MSSHGTNPRITLRPFDMDVQSHVDALSKWSTLHDEMLPLTTESIARHHLSSAAFIGGELAGYAALSVIYSGDVVEFGGLVTNPAFRRQNVGTSLVRYVVERTRQEFMPEQILAFGNEKSSGLFRRLGGKPVEDATTLPNEVWKLCHICPRLEVAQCAGKVCCERVFDLTNIDTNPAPLTVD